MITTVLEAPKTKKTYTMTRDRFKAINLDSINPRTRKQIENLIDLAAKGDRLDEHGGWEFGCSFDKKGRGYARNYSVYGYGKDIHCKRFMAVIQIRQYEVHGENWYPNIKKSYFLLGRNEDDSVFAHPVESRVIHNAINKGKNVIKSVQDWIFGYDYKKVIRQGDLALIPSKRYKELREAEAITELPQYRLIEGSHHLFCDVVARKGESFYTLNPHLIHGNGTHPPVKIAGWFKLVVGKRSPFYSFATPTID